MPRKLLIVLLLFAQTSFAQDKAFTCFKHGQGDGQIIQKVEKAYAGLNSLSAKFHQESSFLGFAEKSESSGEVLFKKPGKMDWQYFAPEEQRFISNGKVLWFYQADLEQVTISDFKDSFRSDLPVSFLLGIGSLQETFKMTKHCITANGAILLDLLPKKDDQSVQEFHLLVSAKDYLPQGARIVDAGGNQTSILLEKLVAQVSLADKNFEFQIPRGLDVIDQRGM